MSFCVSASVVNSAVTTASRTERGAKHRDLAAAFLEKFPIGSYLTVEDFDKFAIEGGYLEPPQGKRGSDSWMGFTLRRNDLKNKINNAAAHTDMRSLYNSAPFQIRFVDRRNSVLQVADTLTAATDTGSLSVMNPVSTLIKTKRELMNQLLQSIDLSTLPAGEQAKVLALTHSCDNLESAIKTQVNFFDRLLEEVKASTSRSVGFNGRKSNSAGLLAYAKSK